jgi:predicted negative regulator of RcsB-dependent stress response
MYRPKKNKIKNPTIADDQQDQLDERHLIDVEDSEEISFEDRIQMYWMENKGFISGCILVLALAIIGFNGMRIYKAQAEAKLQATYMEAIAGETLADFATAHANKDLGGLAALSVADEAYKVGEFDHAVEFYVIAADALADNILAGRAKVGEAFARFYAGKEDVALAQLADIASDITLPEAARTEAAYHLAVEADVKGEKELYQRYVAQVQASTIATQWQQRLAIYEQQAR